MKQWTILSACIAATGFLLLVRCTAPTGGATETGNAKITSMLYNPGGMPAVNAKVCFYPHDNDPRPGKGAGPVDSTTTDASGNYTAKLDSGVYNILATLGDKATFQDSIKVIKDSTVHPPADTLKALGSISGKIELQGTDDPRTVFILFMGSNTFTTVMDTQGNFSAANMAKGKYRVRILTTLDNYKVMDTAFEITAGTDSIIPAPIRLEYTGIPVVKGLRIAYDTMKQIVALTWNKPTNGRAVQSYTIYRKRSDSASFVSIKGGVTDTSYNDSMGVQDQTYEYRVAVVDTNNTEGVKSAAVRVTLESAYVLALTMGNGTGIGTGMFANLSDIMVSDRGRIYAGDAGTALGENTIWVFDTSGNLIDSVGEKGTNDGQIDRVRTLGLWGDTLMVTDQGNKAQVFGSDGHFLHRVGQIGMGDSLLTSDYLLGITFNNNCYFVIDQFTVKVFDTAGIFLFKFAGMGNGPGLISGYETPRNIIADSSGNTIIAVDSGGTTGKLLKYNPNGQYISEFGIPHSVIDFDYKNGLIYCACTDPARVFLYTERGLLYATISLKGFVANSICVSKNGTIFLGADDGFIRKYTRK